MQNMNAPFIHHFVLNMMPQFKNLSKQKKTMVKCYTPFYAKHRAQILYTIKYIHGDHILCIISIRYDSVLNCTFCRFRLELSKYLTQYKEILVIYYPKETHIDILQPVSFHFSS